MLREHVPHQSTQEERAAKADAGDSGDSPTIVGAAVRPGPVTGASARPHSQ